MTKVNKNKIPSPQSTKTKKKEIENITVVCSWIYTGYRKKKTNSWIEQTR
jgi:hypothetical protein